MEGLVEARAAQLEEAATALDQLAAALASCYPEGPSWQGVPPGLQRARAEPGAAAAWGGDAGEGLLLVAQGMARVCALLEALEKEEEEALEEEEAGVGAVEAEQGMGAEYPTDTADASSAAPGDSLAAGSTASKGAAPVAGVGPGGDEAADAGAGSTQEGVEAGSRVCGAAVELAEATVSLPGAAAAATAPGPVGAGQRDEWVLL